jgi:hypothetical protein
VRLSCCIHVPMKVAVLTDTGAAERNTSVIMVEREQA